MDEHGFPQSVREYIEREGYHDLGHEHAFQWTSWRPHRALNPQYDGVPDVGYFGATVVHYKPNGELCMGAIRFDTPGVRAVEAASRAHCLKQGIPYTEECPHWQLISLHPLHVEPSLLCKAEKCGDHGHIRGGRWVPA